MNSIIVFLFGLIFHPLVQAATFAESDNRYCQMTMNGEIELGDHEKLKKFLSEYHQAVEKSNLIRRDDLICLNSPGGNYDEAIRMAETIQKMRVGTVVLDGSQCYSSCAIVFMFGKSRRGQILRRLMVGGALGFHAPYVSGSDHQPKQYFNEGLAAIRKLYGVFYKLNEGRSSYGDNSAEQIFPTELMVRMLTMKADEMWTLETVNDVGRWGIFLIAGPYDFKNRNLEEKKRAWRQACENLIQWNDKIDAQPIPKKRRTPGFKKIEEQIYLLTELGGGFGVTPCRIVEFDDDSGEKGYRFWIPPPVASLRGISLFRGDDSEDQSWMTLDPRTVICDQQCQKIRPFIDVK